MKHLSLIVLLILVPLKVRATPVLLDFQLSFDYSVNTSLSQSLTDLRFQSVFLSKRGKVVLKRFYHVTCENINCRVLSFDISSEKMFHKDLIIKDYLIKNATFVKNVALVILENLELKMDNNNFLITENVQNVKYEWIPEENPFYKKSSEAITTIQQKKK
jgi:hypothetical protein